MCGITGYLAWGNEPPLELDRLRRATNLLRHRGPDAGGYYREGEIFLGHRRLSIIDLAGGQQPMPSADQRYVVSFNGEIYNYIELREQLLGLGHRFETSSDTEVILEGFRAWGTEVAGRLQGMFALAIWDRQARQLYLARDRMGEKPLLLHEGSAGLLFASEMSPLASLIPQRSIDLEALGGYLCLNYVPGDRTLMAGVRRLPPASWRLYGSQGRLDGGRYWSPRTAAPTGEVDDLEGNLDELSRRLDRAVEITLRSDVPVGLFLSGGMDSSLVAESAARQGRLERAYCLDMKDGRFSEWPNASRVAERIGVRLERVRMGDEVLARFVDSVRHADDPLADASGLPVWAVSAAAAEDVKVVVSGDGGDELFGGYLTYSASAYHRRYVSKLPGWVRRGLAATGRLLPTNDRTKVSRSYKAWRFLRAADLSTGQAHFSWNGTWLPDEASQLAADPRAADSARRALAALSSAYELDAAASIDRLQGADIREYLPNDILAKVDRAAMAHGLEVRAPLLNPDVADFALSIPTSHRLHRGEPKRLLRALARRRLGAEIADAPKQGFSIPVHSWLRGPARDLMGDLLARPELERLDCLRPERVHRAIQAHLQGRRSLGWELWGLMVLSAWHRERIVSPPSLRELPEPVDLERLVVGS